ncbi:MAG: TetR/AcrR family transcriptional regulator [Bacilli bacterium]
MSKFEQNKLNFIIAEAKKLMVKSSIDEVTMQVLAKDLGIGEATLYRYFGKKENIVINVAISMWKDISSQYFENIDITSDLTGIECVRRYLNSFKNLYENDLNFILFIKNFDNYIQKSGMTIEQLNEYNNLFEQLKDKFIVYFKKGIADGTIRSDIDPEIYYYSASHSIQNLIIKLASKPIIEADTRVNHLEQIQMAIDAFILLVSTKEG